MNVLVTGWAGYIGPAVLRRLREAGHYTIGVDTGWYLGQYAEDAVYPDEAYFADIREFGPLKVDAAVHLAGLSNDPIGDLDPALTEDINFGGTLSMLVPGARNLVVSSCSVYGVAGDEPSTEASDLHPQSVYAKCKADVDRFLASDMWPEEYEDWVSLRLGTVYGYSPGHRLDLVVNRMAHDAIAKGFVSATGNAARPLTHVEDVADAVLHFLGVGSGVYNIVGENTRMMPLGQQVAAFAGVPIVKRPSGADTRDYMASGERAALAGWMPKHTVAGSLPVLFEHTINLPEGRVYERLPVARRHLERELVAA